MRHILLLLLFAICIASVADAATFSWNNAAGGAFATAANWTPAGGPPGSGDTAQFNLNNTYTVTFSGSPFLRGLTQTQGNVTLDFNNATLNFSNPITNGMGGANLTSTMHITDGNFRPGNFSLATVATSTSNLFLDTEADMRTTSGPLSVGSLGTGNLWVTSDAALTTSAGAVLGVDSGAVGTANVVGLAAAWTNSSSPLVVGGAGTGTLNVTAGGTVTTGNLEVAFDLASVGTVNLSGNLSTLAATGTANIGGNSASLPAASATLNIGTGSSMSVGGVTNLRSNAKVNITGGTLNLTTINITPGAVVNWTAGTVNFDAATTITAGVLDTFLAGTQTLGPNRTLSADNGIFSLTTPLQVSGRISVPTFRLQAGATLQLRDFAALTGTTSVINNGGTFLLGGPFTTITGPVTNTAGIIRGTGRFASAVTNTATGTIRVESGELLTFGAAGSTNAGTIELAGGTIEYAQSLGNQAGGTISGRGVFRGSSATPGGTGLTNNGVLSFSAGLTDIYGDVTNSATGIIVAAGASTVTFYDDVTNNGEIRTVTGSRSVFFGTAAGAGTFTGGGTVEMEGDLKPGNSPANVSFGGNLTLGAGASVDIELGGLTKGSQYDSLTIAGTVALDGALNALLIDGFKPAAGQSFEILTSAGGINGAFDQVTLPVLPGGLHFDFNSTAHSLMLSVGGIAGDFNLNGAVDSADYIIWRKTLGTFGGALAADADFSGMVDSNDYNIWRSNFGATSAQASSTIASVPEPKAASTLVLVVSILVGVLRLPNPNRRRLPFNPAFGWRVAP